MFRIYLRDQHQQVSDKTITGDQGAAIAAFSALVDRADLDGQPMMAVITRNGAPVAHHKFNTRTDDTPHYWRGRIHDLPLQKPAGRPAEMDGGKRVQVYLDVDSIDIAQELGSGNVSAGIRMALAWAKEDHDIQPQPSSPAERRR